MMKIKTWGMNGVLLAGIALSTACVSGGYYQTVSSGASTTTVAVRTGAMTQPFYDDLAPYGRWVYVAGPGWVWSPDAVQADWQPYRLGHWVLTDYGWTWSSDESFGWATYHYGRWHQDADFGWVWVPGTEWGPAWVAWHEGGGYVGWAPLPWQVRFEAGVGLDWGGVSVSIQPSHWCFVGANHLVDPVLRGQILPPARNVTLVQVTQNVTNYTYVDNRVVNEGVRVDRIGRAVGHNIPRYHVTESQENDPGSGGRVRGQDFVVFRKEAGRDHAPQRRETPPGHDDRERIRDERIREERARDERMRDDRSRDDRSRNPHQETQPPHDQAQVDTNPPPPAPPAPPDQGPIDRGRKFFEDHANRGGGPRNGRPQSAPASQPPPASPGNASAPPSSAGAGTPPSGGQQGQGTSAPPASPAPAKGQPGQGNGKGPEKGPDKNPHRGGKPKGNDKKPDAPESNGNKPDKPDSH